MNGYSRIRKVSRERSKSIDYTDISFVPKTTSPNPIKNQTSKLHENNNKENQKKYTDIHRIQEPMIQESGNEEDTAGEIFGVILSRKCSVSLNSSNNFLCEKQSSSSSSSSTSTSSTTSVNSVLKRTLSSIKRSSSVSDGYRRIHHHQSDSPSDDDDDDILMLNNTSQTRSTKKKGGKFFKACKRILGF